MNSPSNQKPLASLVGSPTSKVGVQLAESTSTMEASENCAMGNMHHGSRSRRMADQHQSKWKEAEDLKWGYGRDRGPDTWWVHYPAASGNHQSPINIDPELAEYDSDLTTYPLRYSYRLDETKTMVNTGTGCQVEVSNRGSHITGGPLGMNKYKLKQFHFHWGGRDDCGSEHTVHGRAMSAELHLVHWNCTQFSSYEDAAKSEGGLAVLAVLIKTSVDANAGIDYLMQYLPSIPYAGQSIQISTEFDISHLVPEDTEKYWAYTGSLTTPPCYESVSWVVYQKSLTITPSQLALFRDLNSYRYGEQRPLDEGYGKIEKNFRPVQAKGTRKIRTMANNFMSKEEFHEQFHEQSLFTKHSEFKCQYQRQGLM